MSTLCWNFRGFGNPRLVRALRQWCISLGPDILFLSETKVHKNLVENKRGRLGYLNAFGVSSMGRVGGLCLFWKEDNVNFSLVSFS